MFEALRERLLLVVLLGVAPSVLLLLIGIAAGDYKFFVFINQGLVNYVLDFVCVYASPVCFFIVYSFTLIRLLLSKTNTLMISGVSSLGTGPAAYVIGSLLKQLVKRPDLMKACLEFELLDLGMHPVSHFRQQQQCLHSVFRFQY